jgi:hypothetical protein
MALIPGHTALYFRGVEPQERAEFQARPVNRNQEGKKHGGLGRNKRDAKAEEHMTDEHCVCMALDFTLT